MPRTCLLVMLLSLSAAARPAPPHATALSHEKLLSVQCLGAHAASGRFWFNVPAVSAGEVHLQVLELGLNVRTTRTIARVLGSSAGADPRRVAAAVSNDALALANTWLAEVDTPCVGIAPPVLGAPPVALSALIEGRAVEASTVAGVHGPALRLRGPRGARLQLRLDEPERIYSAPGSRAVVVQTRGEPPGFQVFDVAPLAAQPRRFALPDALPACLWLRQPYVLAVEDTAGRVALVLRPIKPPHTPRILAEGPPGTDADALLAMLTGDRLIDLAEVLPAATETCHLAAIGPSGEVELNAADGPTRLGWKASGARFTATLVAQGGAAALHYGEYRAPLKRRPEWVLTGPSRPYAIAMGGGFEAEAIESWELLPQAPADAARGPKLLDRVTPPLEPADRRCLAWNSADRSMWVVRWQLNCEGKCRSSAVLTEVRRDGHFQRVTLNKDQRDWTHMFSAANTLLRRADLGCVAGRTLTLAGRAIAVTSDGLRVSLTVGERTKVLSELEPGEGLRTAFGHPDLDALVVEIHGEEGVRYVWVDLGRF